MVVKSSALTKVTPVYRGIAHSTLPDWFWTTSVQGVHGCVDAAFVSASFDKSVAADFSATAQTQKAAVAFEIHQGLTDRGAQLEWISQWPHEHEVTHPPPAPPDQLYQPCSRQRCC